MLLSIVQLSRFLLRFVHLRQLIYFIISISLCQELFWSFLFFLPLRFVSANQLIYIIMFFSESQELFEVFLFSFYMIFNFLQNQEKSPDFCCPALLIQVKRRKRDLNPRAGRPTYTLSRGASSASWVFLRTLNSTIESIALFNCVHQQCEIYYSNTPSSCQSLFFIF